jgi:hypothetical protein
VHRDLTPGQAAICVPTIRREPSCSSYQSTVQKPNWLYLIQVLMRNRI